jgi:excisionase family DNA binding protein
MEVSPMACTSRLQTATGTIHRHVSYANHGPAAPVARLAVTVEEGARMLGIGRATLYKLVMRGEIDSFTIGRARRIAISTLEQFARERRCA